MAGVSHQVSSLQIIFQQLKAFILIICGLLLLIKKKKKRGRGKADCLCCDKEMIGVNGGMV